MKFTHLLTLLLLVTVFSSCGDDDKDPAELIVGTWNVTAFDGTLNADIISDTETLMITSTLVGSEFNTTMTFNENGTYTSVGSYSATETYTSDGQTETDVYVEEDGLFENGTYNIVNDLLTITDIDDDVFEFDINNISSSKLDMTSVSTRVIVDGTTTSTYVTTINVSLAK